MCRPTPIPPPHVATYKRASAALLNKHNAHICSVVCVFVMSNRTLQFSLFLELSQRRGVQKLKTVGDAWIGYSTERKSDDVRTDYTYIYVCVRVCVCVCV